MPVVADDLCHASILGPAEQVAGVGEGRLELAGLGVLVGVPADVVEVQVRAHHGIDILAADAEAFEVLEEPFGQIAEHIEVALAPGADAGVDHDHPARRLHHEALEVHPLLAVGRGVVRVQPFERDHLLGRRVGHGHVDVVLEVPQLDDRG